MISLSLGNLDGADHNSAGKEKDEKKKKTVTKTEFMTGDPVLCKKCGAIFSQISSHDQNKWACEFCGNFQDISLEPEEVPKGEFQDYLLSPPSTSTSASVSDNSIVVFVVDISGSMTVTTEIPKGFGLFAVQTGGQKSKRMLEEEELMKSLNPEGYNQFIPGKNFGESLARFFHSKENLTNFF